MRDTVLNSESEVTFSIVVPVYNRRETIEDCIQSVMQQSYQNWKLIVIDDHSDDGTYEICRRYAKDSSAVSLVRFNDNQGVSVARNQGISSAEGDYICFLDSDDQLEPNALQCLFEVIVKEQVDIIVFGIGRWSADRQLCNKVLQQNSIRQFFIPELIGVRPKTKYFLKPFVINKCFRKNFIQRNQLAFDDFRRNWEDGIFVARSFNKCEKLWIIDKSLYRYDPKKVDNHLSKSFNEAMIYNRITEYLEYYETYGHEYDFDTSICAREYLDSIYLILRRVRKNLTKEDFYAVLDKALNNQIIRKWVTQVETCCANDLIWKLAVSKNNKALMERIYH